MNILAPLPPLAYTLFFISLRTPPLRPILLPSMPSQGLIEYALILAFVYFIVSLVLLTMGGPLINAWAISH